jgi:small subunit ribosomal protein S9
METVNATGRRKTAIARVYVNSGNGKITINKRELNDYFPVPEMQIKVLKPLKIAEATDKYDITVNLTGGGIKGQAEALSLGITRALIKIDAEIKPALKAENLVTRDPRVVERKKPGQPKARKKFQFSKR